MLTKRDSAKELRHEIETKIQSKPIEVKIQSEQTRIRGFGPKR